MVLQLISIFLLLVVVWILRADRRIVRSLRRAGATTPEKAVSFKTSNPLFQWRIRHLRSRQAIRNRKNDRIFLDEDGWTAFRQRRRKRMAIITGFAAAAVLAWYLIFAGS